MARTRATAVSAIVLALGLTGVGVAPFVGQSASASVSRAAFDPAVEPCDAGQTCDPQTTVTVTTTLGTPTPEEAPETTITHTVTASPTKTTKAPKPPKTTTAPTPPPVQETTQQPLAPLPTAQTTAGPLPTEQTTEPSVEMPSVAPTDPPATTAPLTADTAPTTDSVQLEVRAAAPEFDQKSLTQKLSIPALVLVLLALFAVLIFEGRLRRMAHAAAVRKAGPPMAGSPMGRPDAPPPGYPAGPGYATASFPAPGYPGGTAYAPIISFVPIQTYPAGQPGYGPAHHDPAYHDPYGPQGGYPPEPAPTVPATMPANMPATAPEPVVLHPDEFDSYNEPPQPAQDYRDPFEPLIPAEQPPAEIPPGGGKPYEDEREFPLAPAAAAESGDSEPWQQGPSLFEPKQPVQPRPPVRPQAEQPEPPEGYRPPPYLPPEGDAATVVQPLPPQPPEGATKEMQDPKHRKKRWGRK
ncbi:hypothetical protein AB0C33_32615 [Nonomuraea sp. NPDC048881]|uniref:hypothetical protein n=1 Tax=Nonomuraea sp. NPDC048881 TaxID=3155030 RepID=UPI0033EB9EE5